MNNNKRKDFTSTNFIGKGLNLVTERGTNKFYLVNEKKYDLAGSDHSIECEELQSIENEKNIKYFRFSSATKVLVNNLR